MIPYNEKALQEVVRNRENIKKKIPNEISAGFTKLESYIDGVNQEVYYLIAGGTGSGKTKYVDFYFVLKPISFVLNNPDLPIDVNILYFSLEISGSRKAINLASFYIFAKYGITLTAKQIRSKNGYELSDKEYEMVVEAFKWVNSLSKHLTIYDSYLDSKKLYAILKKYSEEHGTWTKDPKTSEHTYTPKNPYLYTIVIIDHIGLIKPKAGSSKKQEIDDCSQHLIWFRNKCRFTPVAVSQYNRNMESTDRIKFNALTPQLADLKETGNPAEDANVVLAMFPPYRFRLEEYRGYNVKRLQDRLRTITILKNRDGEAEKTLGFGFYGEVGLFSELKKGEEMTEQDYKLVLNYLSEWKHRKLKT